MKNTYVESAIGFGIALSLFLGGMGFAHVFKRWESDPGDAATWAGAVMAGLAFGGTIVIATKQWRDQKRQAHARAVISAIQVTISINALYLKAQFMIGQVEKQLDPKQDFFAEMASEFETIRIFDREHLVDLIEFGRVATEASLVKTTLEVLIDGLRMSAGNHIAAPKQVFELSRMAARYGLKGLMTSCSNAQHELAPFVAEIDKKLDQAALARKDAAGNHQAAS